MRKELGRASTWTSIVETTKSVREKEKIREEVKKDPKLAEAQKMMMRMPAPGKVDIQKPQRLNFVSMAKKEWTKKTFYYTADEVAKRKQEKWIRRLHPEDGEPFVFDYDGSKETKKNARDALLKFEQDEKEEQEYSYHDPRALPREGTHARARRGLLSFVLSFFLSFATPLRRRGLFRASRPFRAGSGTSATTRASSSRR